MRENHTIRGFAFDWLGRWHAIFWACRKPHWNNLQKCFQCTRKQHFGTEVNHCHSTRNRLIFLCSCDLKAFYLCLCLRPVYLIFNLPSIMQTVVYWVYQEGYFNCILQLKYMQITEYLTNTTCNGLYVLCLLSAPKTPLILVQTQQTLLCFISVTICFQLNNTPIRVTQCLSLIHIS